MGFKSECKTQNFHDILKYLLGVLDVFSKTAGAKYIQTKSWYKKESWKNDCIDHNLEYK